MRATLIACVVVACACAPKPVEITAEKPARKPTLERLPADAVLWEGPTPPGVDEMALLEKDGILTKNKEPDEDSASYWPFAVDYWGLARTDLATLLEPHVGRTVRVRGHYKKIYDQGAWVYEVEPVTITALAEPPK